MTDSPTLLSKRFSYWWRWFLPRLFVVTAAGLLILALVSAYSRATNWFEARPKTVLSYADISLGMGRTEVAYRRGTPKQVSRPPASEELKDCQPNTTQDLLCESWLVEPAAGAKINDFPGWTWDLEGNSLSASLTAIFDSHGKVEKITCYDAVWGTSSTCPQLFSLGIGSSESEILIRLGRPSYENIDPESYVKTLSFDGLNLSFYLMQGKTYMVEVTQDFSK